VWIGAELPGSPLVLTVDSGGERWNLAGRPLHAGDGLELLTEGERSPCRPCDEQGCAECGGRGYTFAPLWLRVGFEYVNGKSEALLYLRAPGAEREHAIRVRAGDRLRCRWVGA